MLEQGLEFLRTWIDDIQLARLAYSRVQDAVQCQLNKQQKMMRQMFVKGNAEVDTEICTDQGEKETAAMAATEMERESSAGLATMTAAEWKELESLRATVQEEFKKGGKELLAIDRT